MQLWHNLQLSVSPGHLLHLSLCHSLRHCHLQQKHHSQQQPLHLAYVDAECHCLWLRHRFWQPYPLYLPLCLGLRDVERHPLSLSQLHQVFLALALTERL